MIQQNDSTPALSVLTPVLNGRKYIERCLNSVIDQGLENVEHVISDGGSTDGTLEILKEYSKRFPTRVRYICKKDNGVGSALKNAYAESKGRLIAWLDADDEFKPESLVRVLQEFEYDLDANFIYGNCDIIDSESKLIGHFIVKDFDRWHWLNEWHYIVFCATFFTRRLIEDVGFVNDLGNDLDFYLRVVKKYKLKRIDFPFTNYRLHDGSISLKRSKREEKIRVQRAFQDFCLVLRYGGSLFSPRALTFVAVMEPRIKLVLYPLYRLFPGVFKRLAYAIRLSIAQPSEAAGSYMSTSFQRIKDYVVFRK